MKNLVIDTIGTEIRVFNEKNQNWETQQFNELNLGETENFATIIEEIQDFINEHNEYEVTVIIEMFGRKFVIELFKNSIQCKGFELFNPETKECWFKSINNELLFNCISKDWDSSGLKVQKISFPDGHGTETEKDGYVYVLEQGDYDIYDLVDLSNR